VPKEKPVRKKTSLAGQRDLSRAQVKKGEFIAIGRMGRQLRRTTKTFREKIRRVKAQLELNLAPAIKDSNILATKGGLRRISILYWMQGEG